MLDWRDNPKAHEFIGPEPLLAPHSYEGKCMLCGYIESAHDGSEIPLDQQMREMGAPMLPGFGDD